ncbi:hypothetical protein Cgig2_000456 [Carnegiea gigantea]|uniref:Uncharacterized protein n=1 Tax=Carnegiea gigantea TaxID=171969 RepID=A0A9Q1QCJ6_9CARY|nr:hypothetical protein Cgig2_000456 [Carnegiea gigantea]
MAFPPLHDSREMADFVKESSRWHWRSVTHPPRPLPDDYRDLCSRFTLSDAERAALDFELSEMVQATFYAMPLNDVIELGMFAHMAHILEMVQAIFYVMVINEVVELELLTRASIDHMMSDLRELKWDIIEAWLEEVDKRLKDAQVPRLVEILANPQPLLDVTSRLKGALSVSSDEE